MGEEDEPVLTAPGTEDSVPGAGELRKAIVEVVVRKKESTGILRRCEPFIPWLGRLKLRIDCRKRSGRSRDLAGWRS
jgi:hypothetical protein